MILIIHHDDLDGWTAAKIVEVQESKKEKVLLLPFNYGDEVPDTTKYSLVYILDLSLNAFPNLPLENVIHIDHHSGPLSSKTVLCKSSVTKFCWEWFHSEPNLHITAIDEYDTKGECLSYALGIMTLDWTNERLWKSVLSNSENTLFAIEEAGDPVEAYLTFKENSLFYKAPYIQLPNKERVPLLQGPIHTLKRPYIAFQIKISTVDFKIQHRNALNIALHYGGSGHGNVGGFTKSLKEGLNLLQNWL